MTSKKFGQTFSNLRNKERKSNLNADSDANRDANRDADCNARIAMRITKCELGDMNLTGLGISITVFIQDEKKIVYL